MPSILKNALTFFIISGCCFHLSHSANNKLSSSQQQQNQLTNSMSSLNIRSSGRSNAEFNFGTLNNFFSFLLKGPDNKFSITKNGSNLLSINNKEKVTISSNKLNAENGLTYTGDFKVRGVPQWKLVYEEDFSEEVSGWSNNTASTCGGVHMLGGYCKFGGGEVSKTFEGLPEHKQIKIEATFHFIDAWDGESGYMKVDIGGNNSTEYVWVDQYSAFLGNYGINICGGRWPEGKFSSPINVVFPHKKESIRVIFGATIEQDPCDESFGVSGMRIYIR